jgi:CysZ protein
MIVNLFKGFGHAFTGLQLITRPGIRRFVVVPVAINVVLFSIAIYFLVTLFDQAIAYFMPNFPDWLSWLETAINWLLWPLFAVMIFFLVFYTFTFVANLIAAPFNSLLAEKVEAMLKGQPLDDSPSYPVWSTVKKSIASEIGKLWYLIKWSILLLIISFIPVVNVAAPPLWIVFGAWMLALEYLDYPMGNHGHFFKEINQQATSRKTLSLGFGSGLFLLTSIPVINFIAMPAGVAGATNLWVKQENGK